MNKKKKTLGHVASDLLKKEPESRDPIELQREMQKQYESNVFECIDRNKNNFSGDFYISVLTKREKLLPNVLRNYFFATQSCPTPNYDQTVYCYHRDDEVVSFMWVVPSRDTCFLFRENALNIDPKEKELLKFILDFDDGTLLKWSKKLNREL